MKPCSVKCVVFGLLMLLHLKALTKLNNDTFCCIGLICQLMEFETLAVNQLEISAYSFVTLCLKLYDWHQHILFSEKNCNASPLLDFNWVLQYSATFNIFSIENSDCSRCCEANWWNNLCSGILHLVSQHEMLSTRAFSVLGQLGSVKQ